MRPPVDLQACKAYMQLDADDTTDDALVEDFRASAEEYLRDAGILRSERNAARYDLCIKAMTLHWYDHRDSVGTELGIPGNIRPVINQLKMRAVGGACP